MGEKVVQFDLRPTDGLHPPGGEGLEMPDEFPHAAVTSFLHPERRTQLRTKGLMQHNEEQAAIPITSCRVFFLRFARRSMQITLPRLHDAFALPASRLYLDDRFSLPDGLRDLRDKAIPGSPGQVSLGGRRAFLLRVLPGFSPSLMHPHLGHPGDKEPRRDRSFCAHAELLLSHGVLDRVPERAKRTGTHMPSNRFRAVRLRLEATEKIGSGFGHVSHRLDFTVPSSPEKPDAFLC